MVHLKDFKWFSKNPFTILMVVLFFSACNNEDKKESKETTTITDTTATRDTGAVAPMTTQYIHTVILTRDKLIRLFRMQNDHKMFYLKFSKHGGAATDQWSLTAYVTDKAGRPTGQTVDIELDIVTTAKRIEYRPATDTYQQIVTRGNLKDFFSVERRVGQDRIIPEKFFEDVWLTPCRRADGLIEFYVSRPNAAPADCPRVKIMAPGDIVTNPSPPGTPCMENCDELQYREAGKK